MECRNAQTVDGRDKAQKIVWKNQVIALQIKWRQVGRDIALIVAVVAGLAACYGVGATVANPYSEVVSETPISHPHYVFLTTVLGGIIVAAIFGAAYGLYLLTGLLKQRWTYDNLEKTGDQQ